VRLKKRNLLNIRILRKNINLSKKSVDLYTIMSAGPNGAIGLTTLDYKTWAGQILDDRLLQDFEARMIRTDMGVTAASRIVERIRADHGGRTIDVDAVWKTIHDEMVALTSHLPHLAAYAFMNWVATPHSAAPRDFAGPGLMDFTRIAASDPHMWRQILAANRDAVLAQYDGWPARLDTLIEHLRNGRFDELEALLAAAQATRAALAERSHD